MGHLYRFVTRSTQLEEDSKQTSLDVPMAVNRAAIMRESALKSVIFVGVPRVSFRKVPLSSIEYNRPVIKVKNSGLLFTSGYSLPRFSPRSPR